MSQKALVLMELYQALWFSADFESDLEKEFPQEFDWFKKAKPAKVPMETLNKMYAFMRSHPAFN